jgi:hypothetical protein
MPPRTGCSVKTGRTDTVPQANARCRITPLSQIINIVLFSVFALVSKSYSALVLQCLVLLLSFILCGISPRDIPLKQLAAVLPVIGFVLILNCFRGTGEVLFRIGPFVIVKQGVFRGILYSVVIVQLWVMSKLLTIGFTERQLLQSVSSDGKTGVSFDAFLVLYYILRIFHNTYMELRTLFSGTRKGIKGRTVRFLVHAFERSKEEYDRLEDARLRETGTEHALKKATLLRGDLAYLSVQAGVLILAYFMRDLFIRL